MEALKSYLYTAMLAALVSSVVIRLCDPRHRKYVRFGAGLCLLLALTSPLLTLTDDLASLAIESPTLSQEPGENSWMGTIGQEMSVQIGDLTANRFAIPREQIRVKLTLDLSDLSAIELVRVDMVISSACDAEAIETYLSDALGCPIEVMVE